MGSHKKVYIVEMVIERKALKKTDRIIHDFDPDTFYTVEDIRMRKKGIFPKSKHFRHFTSQSLVSEFSGHFEVLEIKPFERRCLRLKLLQRLLVNRFFILNNGRALDAIYRFYKKSLFEAEEKNCQRLYLKLRRC